MTQAFRLLAAVALMSLATASLAAKKKKPVVPAGPAIPAPCVDFYSNVNFAWLKAHPLPAGAASYSRWDELNASADQQVHVLLSSGQAQHAGPASNLLADLVASGLDNNNLDAAAHLTAQPLLAQIDAIRKPKDIIKVVTALHLAGVPVLFGFDALRDPDSGQPRTWFYPGGIGLPDPAYYTAPEPELQHAVALYRAHVDQLLKFAGVPDAKRAQQADYAFAIEQALAAAMSPASKDSISVDPAGKNAFPAPFMAGFLQAQDVSPTVVSVRQPGFFTALDAMLAKPSIPQWQAYLRTQVLESLAPAMARDLRQPYLAALNGLPANSAAMAPADRLAALTRQDASELLSAAYTETYLNSADEQRADAIGEAIRASMDRTIDRVDWLSPEGKAASKTKVAAMRLAIGKPNEPVSFAGLSFNRANYAANLLALRRWNRARNLARLSSAVWPWPVSQTQPAIGYQPAENQLIVTASALHPPAFEGKSAATDYGSFGALVAQQMSLGFADYTANDGRALAFKQQGLVAQFNAYPITPMVNVNGLRMERQNAADLAAIEIAWDAFNGQGAPDPLAKQEFFRAWAAVWARQENLSALVAAQTLTAFAPAKWRVNGPLSNTPGFEQAFACKPGQAMFKSDKEQLSIWR
jgi:putative endopeptidase